MSVIELREVVARANERLKAGEAPADVPCPKCQNHRYVSTETVGKYPMAACACCGFHWFVV